CYLTPHRGLISRWFTLFCLVLTLAACDMAPAVPTAAQPPVSTQVSRAPAATLAPTGTPTATAVPTQTPTPSPSATPTPKPPNPLEISAMRARQYPGSDLIVEGTLDAGANYQRHYASYLSDGLTLYGMLT